MYQMDTMIAIQDVVSTEPEAGEPPDSAQSHDAAIESRLAEEISTLWSDHVRLSAERKLTGKELRQIRARLAEQLHQMKALLARPGRGGEWRGWLRERGIPRSSADRLVARYAETLGSEGELHTEAISDPTPNAEKLATSVWSTVKKTLVTGESVIEFLGKLAHISGVPHEWRDEGLMIFHAASKPANGVTSTGVSAEAACPAPLPAEGDGHPAESPATVPAPPPSDEVPDTATQEPSGDVAAPPAEVVLIAAASDVGQSSSSDVVTP
jgi:hypothetical protein